MTLTATEEERRETRYASEVKDKRAFHRVRPGAKSPVDLQLMGDGFLEGRRAHDISEGGVAIYVPHNFDGCELSGAVDLLITLGKERPFIVRAVIRHLSKGDGYFGVEFTQISDEARAKIRTYVEQRMRERGLLSSR